MNIKKILLIFSIVISSLFTSCSDDDNILLIEDEIAQTEPENTEGTDEDDELTPNN